MEFKKYQHLERLGTTEVQNIELGECYVFPKILSKWKPSGLSYIKEKAWKEIIKTTKNNVALEIQKESKAEN